MLLNQGHEEIDTIVEVDVQSAVGDTRLARNFTGGCAGKSLLAQHTLRRFENLPACLARPRPRSVRFCQFLSDALIIAVEHRNMVNKNDHSLTRKVIFSGTATNRYALLSNVK